MINSVSNQMNNQYNALNYQIAPNNNAQNAIMPSKKAKLSIFYINDLHGNVDNMSGMIAASDKFDKETAQKGMDALKLSGGDNFSGGDDKKNQLVINLLTRMGINASALGNHEFDSTISTFYKFLNHSKTKFLAANAKAPNGSEFYNNVQKSTVMEINGNKYGIIGLLPFDLETVTGADDKKMEGIRPEDINKSIETVNEEAKKLTEQGVNKIILVSHIGNDKDKEIAPKLHGVDIIVGGHSHTEVNNIVPQENLLNNADNKPVLIVQTGENAKHVGVLNVDFDENGVPVVAENNLIKTSQEKSPVLNHLKDSMMGKSPQIATISNIDPLPKNRRIVPCAWTNFMADAMRTEANVDIAFINAANTRKTPKAGILTERDVSESTPLKNTLLVKNMTEKEVVVAIKEALSATFGHETGEPGILHTSGLNYTADNKGNLLELSFVDKQGNKTPIDINNPSDKVYSVCYDSFVAKGTEYPAFIPEKSVHKEIIKTFDFDKDKLAVDHIKKNQNEKELNIVDDGRIKILDENGSPMNAVDSHKTKEEIQKNVPNEISQNVVTMSPLLKTAISAHSAQSGYSFN